MNLSEWDCVVINSSGGKDSQTALRHVVRLADEQGYSRERIHVVHADLGHEEWPGVRELAEKQAAAYGLDFRAVKRYRADGSDDSILGYTRRRGKWPSSTSRWCTSDFKRGPCLRVITQLGRETGARRILNVFGFRASESPARAKRKVLARNAKASTKNREVWDWLPIHDWTQDDVWADIRESGISYHQAYDLGMPRLSCTFCIFAPRAALITAGHARPDLLAEYVAVERETGHTFRPKQSLVEIQLAVERGEQGGNCEASWNM